MAQVNLGHVVGPGIPSGGTTGQILKKASGTNFDTAWMDAGQLPEVTGLASDLAGEFNASTIYQEGDFSTKDAILHKRNSWGGSTPVAEAWDATHWTVVNVTDEIQADRTAIAGEASTRAAADTALGTDVANLRSDLGIVENTNTATHTIAAGQYVIWKGLLYTASSAIPSGTTLSTSNLTAVSGGGLNSLNGKIATHTIGLDQTKANIESALASYGATLGDNEIKPIIFSISTASAPFTNAVYMGTIKRFGNNSRYAVEVQSLSSAQSGNIIMGLYASSWSWSEVALKSETPKLVASEQLISGSSKTYSLSTGQLYQIMCGHPYGQGYFAIYAGGTAGSARLTEIKTSTNVTVSVASNANSITINAVGQATYVRIVEY